MKILHVRCQIFFFHYLKQNKGEIRRKDLTFHLHQIWCFSVTFQKYINKISKKFYVSLPPSHGHPACLHRCMRSHFSWKSSVSTFNLSSGEKYVSLPDSSVDKTEIMDMDGKGGFCRREVTHGYWWHHAYLRPCSPKELGLLYNRKASTKKIINDSLRGQVATWNLSLLHSFLTTSSWTAWEAASEEVFLVLDDCQLQEIDVCKY